MIARRPRRHRLRRLLMGAAWSVALFIVMFIMGLAVGGSITERYGW